MKSLSVLLLLGFYCCISKFKAAENSDDLLVVTVATDTETDGYKRFIRSLNLFGYKHEVIRVHNL